MSSGLKRCKRHMVLPILREVKPSDHPYLNSPLLGFKQFKYVCEACECEKEQARKQPLIDEWNRKQDEAEYE